MKNRLFLLMLGLALGTGAGWVIFHRSAPPAEKAATAEAAPEEAAAEARTVELKPPQLAQIHLQVELARSETAVAEEIGLARTLDPTGFLSLNADLNVALATLATSGKEAARAHDLHDHGENASEQAVEAADFAAQRDRIQVDTARAKLRAAWGPILSADEMRARLAAALTGGESLLRIDFGTGAALPADGQGVALRSLTEADPHPTLPAAEILGAASAVDPQFQGRSFWALVRGETLPMGSSYAAVLPVKTSAGTVLTLPEKALVRDQGSTYVYLQTSPGKFSRCRIEVLRPVGARVGVTGIGAADRVVVVGAQQLLSAELGGTMSADKND